MLNHQLLILFLQAVLTVWGVCFVFMIRKGLCVHVCVCVCMGPASGMTGQTSETPHRSPLCRGESPHSLWEDWSVSHSWPSASSAGQFPDLQLLLKWSARVSCHIMFDMTVNFWIMPLLGRITELVGDLSCCPVLTRMVILFIKILNKPELSVDNQLFTSIVLGLWKLYTFQISSTNALLYILSNN